LGGQDRRFREDYEGLDGLRIKDLPELEIKGDKVNFKNIPTIIVIRPELSKIRKQYFTFPWRRVLRDSERVPRTQDSGR
jgi:hypothetical protein